MDLGPISKFGFGMASFGGHGRDGIPRVPLPL
jgi:hypothetical protein